MRARDVGLKPALWKNNFEEFYANEDSGASWQERPLLLTLIGSTRFRRIARMKCSRPYLP
jgi:hypothetical protein